MLTEIRGKALRLGDNIDTDQIYPSRYIELTEDADMAKHALEGVHGNLPPTLTSYRILVAGRNFGCGSSREHAPRSLKAAGIKLIMAQSFGRIFYRNSINLGLPAIQLDSDIAIEEGDDLVVYPMEGRIRNLTQKTDHHCINFSGFVAQILKAGGLVNYFQAKMQRR